MGWIAEKLCTETNSVDKSIGTNKHIERTKTDEVVDPWTTFRQ